MSARMMQYNKGKFSTGPPAPKDDEVDPPKSETPSQDCATGTCDDKCPELTGEDRAKLMAVAQEWVGTLYASSGHTDSGAGAKKQVGADCSGSVWAVYTEAGFSYPYKHTASFSSLVTKGIFIKIEESELKAGDVVFWSPTTSVGHMMLYHSGSGDALRVIGARSSGKKFSEGAAKWFDIGRPRSYYRYCKKA